MKPAMPLSEALQTPPWLGSNVGKPDLQAAAVEYLGHPEVRTAELDGTLLGAVVSKEASALGSDMLNYLRYARVIEALGYVGVYLAMPSLVYLLYVSEHSTLATLACVGGLIAVAVHVVAAPYRCQDRARAHVLLQRSYDLSAVLGRQPVLTQALKAALDRASAAGMVFDGWILELLQRVAASDERATAGQPFGAGAAVDQPH